MFDSSRFSHSVSSSVFISYSRQNRAFARALYEKLEGLGFPLWRDLHDLEPGEDWWQQIQQAIEGSESMVLCLSVPALQSEMVAKEWHYARRVGTRVIPVLADEVFQHPDVLSGKVSIPRWMKRADWLDFRPGVPDADLSEQRFLNTLKTPHVRHKVPFMVEDLPANFVQRPREFDPLIRALVDEAQDAVAISAALRGAGGFGKTTLARAVCHDPRVRGAFDDGILWVTLGEKPGDLTSKVLNLVEMLTGHRPSLTDLDSARAKLVEALGERYLLVVIDDV